MRLGSLLLLACIQVIAQNSYQTFESDNFLGLKDATGNIVIAPVYENLGWTNGSKEAYKATIGVKNGQKWGLMSIGGKELTPPIYDKIEPFFGDYYKVAFKGRFTNRYFYGLIDTRGGIKLNIDYFELHQTENLVIATQWSDSRFLQGALNAELNWLTPISYKNIRQLNKLIIAERPNGQFDVFDLSGKKLATELDQLQEKRSHLITNHRGKAGKISYDGLEVIKALHKRLSTDGEVIPFSRWLVDPDGENFEITGDSLTRWNLEWLVHRNDFFQIYSDGQIISDEYKMVALGKQNIIARSNGNSDWLALNISGKPILHATDSIKIIGNFLIVKQKKHWLIYDRAGRRITKKTFESVVDKNSRYLAVKNHDYWAILDGVKKKLSPFRYDEVADIIGTKAIVKYIDQWGVFHQENGWTIQPNFNKISYSNGHFIAKKRGNSFLFDEDGFLRFQTIDNVIPRNDMLLVFHEGNFSVIGKHGRPLANTEYQSVTKWGDFFELQSLETTELLHEDGRSILSSRDKIQDITGFSEGLFLIRKNDHYGFVDVEGKLRIANRYDSARVFSGGYAPIKLRGKWGFIDEKEALVIQPHYQKVSGFKNGIATYKLDDLYGFLDMEGKEISKPIYTRIELTPFGNYIVSDSSGRFGFANENGILSLSPSFEAIQDLGHNRIRTTRNRKVGLLNYTGREVLGFDFDDIQIVEDHLLLRNN